MRTAVAIALFALFAALAVGSASAQAAPAAALIERGRAILTEKCASCHAVDQTGASPLALAPAFRDLHRKYDVTALAEALAEGIVTGHADMPVFAFPPDDIEAIIGYLQSLASSR